MVSVNFGKKNLTLKKKWSWSLKVGDLLKRKSASHVEGEWYALTLAVSEHSVEFMWLDTGEFDGCAKLFMEVV
jgi:hypothetical protein